VTLGVGGYSGKLGKSNDKVDVNHRATRLDAVAAYTDKRVRAGLEYFRAANWNNVTTAPPPLPAPPTRNDKSNGWSAFGSYAFTRKISVFGRYDWVKPSSHLNPSMRDNYFNVGLDYKPVEPIDLALVYKHERVTHGLLSTSNGTIGGPDRGSYDEVGLFGQLSF
jgi:predicted porin